MALKLAPSTSWIDCMLFQPEFGELVAGRVIILYYSLDVGVVDVGIVRGANLWDSTHPKVGCCSILSESLYGIKALRNSRSAAIIVKL